MNWNKYTPSNYVNNFEIDLSQDLIPNLCDWDVFKDIIDNITKNREKNQDIIAEILEFTD